MHQRTFPQCPPLPPPHLLHMCLNYYLDYIRSRLQGRMSCPQVIIMHAWPERLSPPNGNCDTRNWEYLVSCEKDVEQDISLILSVLKQVRPCVLCYSHNKKKRGVSWLRCWLLMLGLAFQ